MRPPPRRCVGLGAGRGARARRTQRRMAERAGDADAGEGRDARERRAAEQLAAEGDAAAVAHLQSLDAREVSLLLCESISAATLPTIFIFI